MSVILKMRKLNNFNEKNNIILRRMKRIIRATFRIITRTKLLLLSFFALNFFLNLKFKVEPICKHFDTCNKKFIKITNFWIILFF